MGGQNVKYHNTLQNQVPYMQEVVLHSQRYLTKISQTENCYFIPFSLASFCKLQFPSIRIHAFYPLLCYFSESLCTSKYYIYHLTDHIPFRLGIICAHNKTIVI